MFERNQFSSVTQSCLTLCNSVDSSTPGFPVHYQLLELAQIHVYQVDDAIQPPHSLSFSSPPAFNLFQHQGLFQGVSSLYRWPKYWRFSISLSNEYSGLISFRMDWLDLLSVHGTLKCLLQHHGSKASILQHSAFFMVQLSGPYMTTGKTIALTRQVFVGQEMALLFNMLLFRLVIAFLPRSKCLSISWLQSPSAVILEPKKLKSITVSIVSPSVCKEVMEPDAMILVFECWALSQLLIRLFPFHPEALQFLFAFCHKGGVICVSEVIDISPSNLDSNLCSIQFRILHDVLCM